MKTFVITCVRTCLRGAMLVALIQLLLISWISTPFQNALSPQLAVAEKNKKEKDPQIILIEEKAEKKADKIKAKANAKAKIREAKTYKYEKGKETKVELYKAKVENRKARFKARFASWPRWPRLNKRPCNPASNKIKNVELGSSARIAKEVCSDEIIFFKFKTSATKEYRIEKATYREIRKFDAYEEKWQKTYGPATAEISLDYISKETPLIIYKIYKTRETQTATPEYPLLGISGLEGGREYMLTVEYCVKGNVATAEKCIDKNHESTGKKLTSRYTFNTYTRRKTPNIGIQFGYGIFPQLGEASAVVSIGIGHPYMDDASPFLDLRNFMFSIGTNIEDPFDLSGNLETDVVVNEKVLLVGPSYRFARYIHLNLGCAVFEREDTDEIAVTWYFTIGTNASGLKVMTKKVNGLLTLLENLAN